MEYVDRVNVYCDPSEEKKRGQEGRGFVTIDLRGTLVGQTPCVSVGTKLLGAIECNVTHGLASLLAKPIHFPTPRFKGSKETNLLVWPLGAPRGDHPWRSAISCHP